MPTLTHPRAHSLPLQECIKLCISFVLMMVADGQGFSEAIHTIRSHICGKPLQTAKMGVPGILYMVQNNLLYLAFENLDAATGSVL